MPTLNRRAAGRRRAWGRGPIILRFDSLEPRELLTAPPPLADLAGSSLVTVHAADWNDTVAVQGHHRQPRRNHGDGPVRRRALRLAFDVDRPVCGTGWRCNDSRRPSARPVGPVQHDQSNCPPRRFRA